MRQAVRFLFESHILLEATILAQMVTVTGVGDSHLEGEGDVGNGSGLV